MEPIPETRRAVDEYGPFIGDGDVLGQLLRSAEMVREVVPSCVGITVASVRNGIAFTLVATDDVVAVLDGVQYLEGGPCVASVEAEATVTFTAEDPTDETRWAAFARATARRGISSTLTLPLLDDSSVAVRGSVNLYAADQRAFDGHHEAVADIFGAWAPGAVTNADLDFDTRQAAQQAPEVLRSEARINQAIGALIASRRYDADEARRMILDVAARAGLDATVIADVILEAAEAGDI